MPFFFTGRAHRRAARAHHRLRLGVLRRHAERPRQQDLGYVELGSNKALGFAYVLGGALVGLLFFAGSILLEYLVVPWRRRSRSR